MTTHTPSWVLGYNAGAAMTIAVDDSTGNVVITHAGSNKSVTWTAAGGFDFVGAMAADALTLSGVLTIDGTMDVGLNMEPSAMTKALTVGAESFAASGLGLPLDGVTTHEGVAFYFDDGGAMLAAGYTEALRARFLVSTAITTADVSLYTAHDYVYLAADVTTAGGVGGTWGSMLVKTGVTITTSSGVCDFSGAHFTCDVPSGATIGASTWACGVSVGGNLGGIHTGDAAGYRVRVPGAGKWDVGLRVEPLSCVEAIQIGEGKYAAADYGYGIPLDGVTQHSGIEMYFDDGGVKLAAGYTEAIMSGFLISQEITTADVSLYTNHDYVYIAADVSTAGGIGATWASLLVKTGVTITTSSGLCDFSAFNASVDIPSGATIGTNTFASGLSIGGNMGGTHTGNAVGFRLRDGYNGNWDALCDLTSQVTGAANGSGSDVYIDIFIGGVAARIAAKYVSV